MKSLAIAGFVAIILVIAWSAVQVISFLPSAFTSLASLADGVYENQPVEITLVAEESIVNADEPVTVRWSNVSAAGTFALSYACTDGISLNVVSEAGNQNLDCDTNYNLGDVQETTLSVESEKNRFTDVTYQIGFVPATSETVTVVSEDVLTVVNASISPALIVETTDVSDEETDEATAEEVVTEEEVEATEEDTPSTPVAPAPEVVEEFVFEIPVSNPNGFVDLSVTYLGVGRLTSGNAFVPGSDIDNDSRGAFQFEVKNIGTKTSDEWEFTAELPTGGEYDSPEQDPLRPNERSVLTLGFDFPNDDTGIAMFRVAIDEDNDNNRNNDRFDWAVNVVN